MWVYLPIYRYLLSNHIERFFLIWILLSLFHSDEVLMFAMLEADEWIDRLDKPIVASLPSLSYPPPKRRNIYVHGCVKLGGVGTGTERAREPCDRLRDKKPITRC